MLDQPVRSLDFKHEEFLLTVSYTACIIQCFNAFSIIRNANIHMNRCRNLLLEVDEGGFSGIIHLVKAN